MVDQNICKYFLSSVEYPPPKNILYKNTYIANVNINMHSTEQFHTPINLHQNISARGFIGCIKWSPNKSYLLPEIHHPRFKELWITHIPRIKLSRKIPREVTILHWKKRIICKTNEERPPVGNQSRTRGVPEIPESKPLERSDFLDSEKSFRKIKTNQDNPRNLCKMGFSISKLQRPKERYDFRERSNQNRKCPCGQPLHSPGRKSAEPRCSHKVHQPEDDEDSGGESGDGRNPLLPRESESPRPSHCTGISGSATRRDKSPIKYAERFKIPAGERSSSRGRRSTKDRFVHPRTSYTGRRESGYLFSYERRTQSEDTRYQKHKMETRSGAATKIADAGIYQASDQVGYYTRTRLQPYLVSKLPAHSLHGSRREQTDKRDHSREESLYQDFTLGQATRPSLGLGLNPQHPKKFQKYGEDFHYTFPRRRKKDNIEEDLQVCGEHGANTDRKKLRILHDHSSIPIHDLTTVFGQFNRKYAMQKSVWSKLPDNTGEACESQDDLPARHKERSTHLARGTPRVQWKRAANSVISKSNARTPSNEARESRTSQKDLENLGDISLQLLHIKDQDGDKIEDRKDSRHIPEDVPSNSKSSNSQSVKPEQFMICLEQMSVKDDPVPCIHLGKSADDIMVVQEDNKEVLYETDEVLSYKCKFCNAPGAKTWRKHCASCALKDPEVKTEGVSLVEAMKLFNLSASTSPSSSLETFTIGQDNIKDSNEKINDLKPFPVLQSFISHNKRCPNGIMIPGHLQASSAPLSRSSSEPFLASSQEPPLGENLHNDSCEDLPQLIPQLDGHGGEDSDFEDDPEAQLDEIIRYAEAARQEGVLDGQQQVLRDTVQQHVRHPEVGVHTHTDQKYNVPGQTGLTQPMAAAAAPDQMHFNVDQGQAYMQSGYFPTQGHLQPGLAYQNMYPVYTPQPFMHQIGGYFPDMGTGYQYPVYSQPCHNGTNSGQAPMVIENTIVSRTTVPPGGNTLQMDGIPQAGHLSNETDNSGPVTLEQRSSVIVPNADKTGHVRAPATGETNYPHNTAGGHTLDTGHGVPPTAGPSRENNVTTHSTTIEDIRYLVQMCSRTAPILEGAKKEFVDLLNLGVGHKIKQQLESHQIANIRDLHTFGSITVSSDNPIRVLFSNDQKSIKLFSGNNSINKLKLELAHDPSQFTLLEAANGSVDEQLRFREAVIMKNQPLSAKIPPLRISQWPCGVCQRDAVAVHFTQSEPVKVNASRATLKKIRARHEDRAKKEALPGLVHCLLKSDRTASHHHLVEDDTKSTRLILPEAHNWPQILFDNCTTDPDATQACHATWSAASTRILCDGPPIQQYISGQHIADVTRTASLCIHKQSKSRLTINGHSVHGGNAFRENQIAALFTLYVDCKIAASARHCGEIDDRTFQALISRIWTVIQHPVLQMTLPLFIHKKEKTLINHFMSAALDPNHVTDDILTAEILSYSNVSFRFLGLSGPLRFMLPSSPHIFQKEGQCPACNIAYGRIAIEQWYREFIELTADRKFHHQGYLSNDQRGTYLPVMRLINNTCGKVADNEWKPPANLEVFTPSEDGAFAPVPQKQGRCQTQVEKAKAAVGSSSRLHSEVVHPHNTRFKASLTQPKVKQASAETRQGVPRAAVKHSGTSP